MGRRPVVHPAQGNALGSVDMALVIVGPTGQWFQANQDERLARWADGSGGVEPFPGRCPGLGEPMPLVCFKKVFVR